MRGPSGPMLPALSDIAPRHGLFSRGIIRRWRPDVGKFLDAPSTFLSYPRPFCVVTKLAAAFLLGALTGCAVLQPGAEQSVAVDSMVGEALSAARAPAAEQKAALSRGQQRFLQDPTVLNRVRLATLLAVLPAPLRDDARAAELLEPAADAA